MSKNLPNDQETAIAVIPARGGSKGIAKKNLAPLLGIPMLAYSIRAAQDCARIIETIVSTDDVEIAKCATVEGATVVKRPPDLATDTSPTEPAVVHALDWWKERKGVDPDWIVLLQPTSPLRNSSDVTAAFKVQEDAGADSVLSVEEKREFRWRQDGSGGLPLWDIQNRPRRQELTPDYVENGAIYISRPSFYREKNNRLGGKIGLYIMPPERCLDVDTPFDIWLVEQYLKHDREGKS